MEDNSGFSLDSTIKVNYDSSIRTPPKLPLTEAERDYLYENSFSYFHRLFKTRHYNGRCLESSEYQEYYTDKDFMKARAYVFFMRTISIFDKSIYEGPPFGILTKKEYEEEVSAYEVECLIRFKLAKKKNNQYYFQDTLVGGTVGDIVKKLKTNPELSQEAKRQVAITRLSVYWRSRYEFYIGRLIAEIVRDKQKRNRPLLREKGAQREHLKSYSESMKGAENVHQNQEVDFNFINEDSLEKKIFDMFSSGELSDLPFNTKRYLFCSQYLEMSNSELIVEFGDSLASIKKELDRRV